MDLTVAIWNKNTLVN